MTDRERADHLIQHLELGPHPEGGWFRETWRHAHEDPDGRDYATSINFLLRDGEFSHWHRVDAVELWIHGAGGPLALEWWTEGETSITRVVLGQEPTEGQVHQAAVPAHAWQTARPLGAWTLVHCVVVPAFEFSGFALAAPDWTPPIDG